MKYVWIGVGSNLGDPQKQVDEAIRAISKLPCTKLLFCSSYYCSKPLRYQNQPNFLNTVIVLKTNLNPEQLLDYIQYIEIKQGRIRNNLIDNKWMPRTLDLDILLFDKYIINTNKLTIPHYDIRNREFVIYPLIELKYNFVFLNELQGIQTSIMIPKRGLTLWYQK